MGLDFGVAWAEFRNMDYSPPEYLLGKQLLFISVQISMFGGMECLVEFAHFGFESSSNMPLLVGPKMAPVNRGIIGWETCGSGRFSYDPFRSGLA